MQNYKLRTGRYMAAFLLLAGILLFILLVNIAVGSVGIKLPEVGRIIIENIRDNSTNSTIVWKIRLPRIIAALVGGGAVAVSGLLLQIFFRNPIVDSYVLGVSSGSTLFIALFILGGFTFGVSSLSPYFVFLGAFLGATAVTVIVLLFAYKVKSVVTLLVIGLMIGYLCSAATGLLMTFADNEKIRNFVLWTMGSFAGFTWEQVKVLVYIGFPFLFFSFIISKPLNAFLLGEDYAKSMGVNIRAFRICIICISSVLTAVVTAFAGPVAFIGMSVPHIARLSFRTADNRVLVPGVFLLGAAITGLCDLAARMLLAPSEIAISTVTSFFGVPIVVWLLLKRRTAL